MAQQKSTKLSVTASLGVNDEDDEEVAASFLNVNRKIVKTAHEPKPPKDYIDSSKDVVQNADDQQMAKAKEAAKEKKAIRDATSISMVDADKLLIGGGTSNKKKEKDKDQDDAKEAEQDKAEDSNKKADDGNNNEQNKDAAADK